MTQSTRFAPWLAAASVALAVFTAAPARAQGYDLEGFFIEVPIGVGVPIVAETSRGDVYDAGFWTGVNMGYLFALGGGAVAIGPAADFQYAFGNVEDDFRHENAYEDDVYLGRFRAIAGARFVVSVEDAYILTRLGIGLDYVHASWENATGFRRPQGDRDHLYFGLLGGVGMGYRITDLIGVTFLLDIPIGFHDESTADDFIVWTGDMVDIVLSGAVVFFL